MWILMIGVGIVIGWQFPQPEIAKTAQAWVVKTVKGWLGLN